MSDPVIRAVCFAVAQVRRDFARAADTLRALRAERARKLGVPAEALALETATLEELEQVRDALAEAAED
jgi:hypothetical protein